MLNLATSNFILNFGDANFTFVSTIAEQVYNTIKTPLTALCVLAVAFCILGMLFSKDQKRVGEYSQWLKRIVIGFIAFMFVSQIFNLLTGAVNSSDGGTWSVDKVK